MASIKTFLRGYICDEREQNWSREYSSREIARHKEKLTLDHPDKSVTTSKLKDSCVTEEKLSDEILENFSRMKSGLNTLQVDFGKKADKTSVPSKISQLENDAEFITYETANNIILGNLGGYNSTITDIYGRIDRLKSEKADKATTLLGYGIEDAYTKAEIDSEIGDIETAIDAIIKIQNVLLGLEPPEPLPPIGGVDA